MQDYPVQLLTDMLSIYSPSGKEKAISDFLTKELTTLGFRVKKDGIGNVIAEIGQGEPTILLCGHMDTILGNLPVSFENHKLYGTGAVDAKGPLAAMIVAAATLARESALNAKILLVGAVEEATSRGIKHVIKNGVKADYAVFGEPSGVENITIGYKGGINLRITCKTETGHSSSPWFYENALEKAFDLWQHLKATYPPVEKQESPFKAVTACLVKMTGGRGDSKVPSESKMRIDIRVPPQFTAKQVFRVFEGVIKQWQEANPKVKVKVAIMDQNEAFEVAKNSVLVKSMAYAIRKVLDKPATLLRKTGTGDMNILGRAISIPIVTYGPGDSHLDHTRDENIDVREYLQGIEVYKETILKLTELHNKQLNGNCNGQPATK